MSKIIDQQQKELDYFYSPRAIWRTNQYLQEFSGTSDITPQKTNLERILGHLAALETNSTYLLEEATNRGFVEYYIESIKIINNEIRELLND